jgi:hypothetical protein
MPQLTILSKNLPPINALEKSYFTRYRIISEDRNRFSYWSPIYKIPFDIKFSILSASAVYSSNLITATWSKDINSVSGTLYEPSGFDVWIKWSNTDWIYSGRMSSTFMTFQKNTNATTFSIRIYIPTEPIGNSSDYLDFLIFEKNNVSVV